MRTFRNAGVVHADQRLRIPVSRVTGLAGASFKHEHLPAILGDGARDTFFEVHAENYMGAGGPPHRVLETIRRDFPLSIHGVCMSIGGVQPLAADHLERFRQLLLRYEPDLVSEHLAWSTHGGTFFNDLLPLPYTQPTLAHVCEHIDQVQEAIGRPILLENPSTYITFASSTMSEIDFLRAVTEHTGCGLLLDVNNVFVSAINHGFDPETYLIQFPFGRVGEIHLAGHTEQSDDEGRPLLIDSHDGPVANSVWALFERAIGLTGPVPTLVEWDSKLPDWSVLWSQVVAARERMEPYEAGCVDGINHAC